MGLLETVGIGNWFTRGAWASGVFEMADKDGDELINSEELEGFLSAVGLMSETRTA